MAESIFIVERSDQNAFMTGDGFTSLGNLDLPTGTGSDVGTYEFDTAFTPGSNRRFLQLLRLQTNIGRIALFSENSSGSRAALASAVRTKWSVAYIFKGKVYLFAAQTDTTNPYAIFRSAMSSAEQTDYDNLVAAVEADAAGAQRSKLSSSIQLNFYDFKQTKDNISVPTVPSLSVDQVYDGSALVTVYDGPTQVKVYDGSIRLH